MQSHDDRSHDPLRGIPKGLIEKAQQMMAEGRSRITAGASDESVLFKAEHDGMLIRQLPEDEHGVLRISIGRAPAIEKSSYLVYRGDRAKILGLLERAVGALRAASGKGVCK